MAPATNHPTIVEALAAVSADTGAVRKDSRNAAQGFNFRGIDAIVNAVQPNLVKHKVVVVPEVVSIEHTTAQTAKGATMNVQHGTVAYTFYGPAGDALRAVVAAESFDSGDKGTAKFMSVAFRTALLQVLALPTDDPEPDS